MGKDKVFSGYQLLKDELVVFALAVILYMLLFLGIFVVGYGVEILPSILGILLPFILFVLIMRALQRTRNSDDGTKAEKIEKLERALADVKSTLQKERSKRNPLAVTASSNSAKSSSKGKNKTRASKGGSNVSVLERVETTQDSPLELEQLTLKLAELTSKYQEALSNEKTLQEAQEIAKSKIRELQATAERTKNTHELSLSESNSKLESKVAEIEKLVNDQLAAQARYDQLKGKHDELVSIASQPKDTQVEDKLRAEVLRLGAANQTADQIIDQLISGILGLKLEVEIVREVSVENSKSASQSASQSAILVVGLNQMIKDQEGLIKSLRAQVEGQNTTIEELKLQWESRKANGQRIEKKTTSELSETKSKLQKANEEVAKLQAQVLNLNRDANDLTLMCDNKDKKIKKIQEQSQGHELALKKVTGKRRRALTKLVILRTQLAKLNKEALLHLALQEDYARDLRLKEEELAKKVKIANELKTQLELALQVNEDIRSLFTEEDGPNNLLRVLTEELSKISKLLPTLEILQRDVGGETNPDGTRFHIPDEAWKATWEFSTSTQFDKILSTVEKLETQISEITKVLSV